MIEILEDVEVLARPSLDLSELSLDGVVFGAPGTTIPRDRIVEVSFSPLVASSTAQTGTLTRYFDAAGAEIPLARVIDSVIDATGMVHFASKLSFKIVGGRIAGFAIYGNLLDEAFGTFESEQAVIARFGPPDRMRENVTYGDLMGFDFFYAASRKGVSWDAWDKGISNINLGDYPRDF